MIGDALKNQLLLSAIALSLATISFTCWGYFWYAMLFDDLWQSLIGRSELELLRLAEKRGWLQSFNTYFISLAQASGLLVLIRWSRAKSYFEYQAIAAICSLLITVPVLGNAVLFAGQSTQLWLLDLIHFILGYAGMATVFWIIQMFHISFSDKVTRYQLLRDRIQKVLAR